MQIEYRIFANKPGAETSKGGGAGEVISDIVKKVPEGPSSITIPKALRYSKSTMHVRNRARNVAKKRPHQPRNR